MNKSHIKKTAVFSAAASAFVGLMYAVAGQLFFEVAAGLILGYFMSMLSCFLLYLAGHNKDRWILFYVARIANMVLAVALALFVPFFDPIATIISLTITLPVLAYVVNRWKIEKK